MNYLCIIWDIPKSKPHFVKHNENSLYIFQGTQRENNIFPLPFLPIKVYYFKKQARFSQLFF